MGVTWLLIRCIFFIPKMKFEINKNTHLISEWVFFIHDYLCFLLYFFCFVSVYVIFFLLDFIISPFLIFFLNEGVKNKSKMLLHNKKKHTIIKKYVMLDWAHAKAIKITKKIRKVVAKKIMKECFFDLYRETVCHNKNKYNKANPLPISAYV